MAKLPKIARCLLEGNAHQLAFHIGQSLERLLIARAVKIAKRDVDTSNEVLITEDHIRRVINISLFEDACSQLGVILHDEKRSSSKSRCA